MYREFNVRRYGVMPIGSEIDIRICDDCVDDMMTVDATLADGSPGDMHDEDGEYYWVEDYDHEPEKQCDFCDMSKEEAEELENEIEEVW